VDYAAKIYHSPGEFNAPKIREMISNPPSECEIVRNAQVYPQFAWPKSVLTDGNSRECGLLLPLVDPKESFSLDHYFDQALFGKLNSPDEAALSYKLEIAENLAKIVADLHVHQHYFIDCKPQNIRVFKRSHIVTLLDCDGFSIKGGGQRYPAELLSTDYIAPEVQRTGRPASQLGVDQDLYALAVILFQLLNRGTHPFQGIINDKSVVANTNDDKAAEGLYPHGLSANPRIRPRPSSIHHLWDRKTRVLFDRAFSTGSSSSRPTASEWARHFGELLTSKALVRCDKFPTNIEHMRFRGVDCPACYLSSIESFRPAKLGQVGVQTVATSLGQSSAASAASNVPSTSAGSSDNSDWLAGFGLVFCVFLFTVYYSGGTTDPPGNDVAVDASTSARMSEMSFGLDFKRPDIDRAKSTLSIEEERWCVREKIQSRKWRASAAGDYSIQFLNAFIRDYNARCGLRNVSEADKKQVESELNSRLKAIEAGVPEHIESKVTKLQMILIENDAHPGAVDGQFGPSTVSAFQSFQKKRGLSSDEAFDLLVTMMQIEH
jgi:serine/threonine protein kinase